MNNFERAQFLAANALAGVDDLDIESTFRADRLSRVDINHVLSHLGKFERDIKNTEDPGASPAKAAREEILARISGGESL